MTPLTAAQIDHAKRLSRVGPVENEWTQEIETLRLQKELLIKVNQDLANDLAIAMVKVVDLHRGLKAMVAMLEAGKE
jgi:hypothetical protein